MMRWADPGRWGLISAWPGATPWTCCPSRCPVICGDAARAAVGEDRNPVGTTLTPWRILLSECLSTSQAVYDGLTMAADRAADGLWWSLGQKERSRARLCKRRCPFPPADNEKGRTDMRLAMFCTVRFVGGMAGAGGDFVRTRFRIAQRSSPLSSDALSVEELARFGGGLAPSSDADFPVSQHLAGHMPHIRYRGDVVPSSP